MSEQVLSEGRLPVGSVGKRASGWWGMLCLIATEAALFGYLLFSYYYLALQGGGVSFPPAELPKFALSGPNTAILIASSVAVWWGERGVKSGNRARLVIGLLIGLVLGAVFIGIQFLEWSNKNFTLSSTAYGSLYFTITGFHMAHVAAGLVGLALMAIWGGLGYFDDVRHAPISIGAVYWHFVDVVWLTVFFTLYVTPYFW